MEMTRIGIGGAGVMSMGRVGVGGTSGMTVTRIGVGCVDVCCGVVSVKIRSGKPSCKVVGMSVVACTCCVVCA